MVQVTIENLGFTRPSNIQFDFSILSYGTARLLIDYGDGNTVDFQTNCSSTTICITKLAYIYINPGNYTIQIKDFESKTFLQEQFQNIYHTRTLLVYNQSSNYDLSNIEQIVNILSKVN